MQRGILYLLVEGKDDELFCERLLSRCFSKVFDDIRIIQWAEKSAGTVNKLLLSFQDKEYPYIFFGDFRRLCITGTKQDLAHIYEALDLSQILVVVKEIEGWYIAGLDDAACERLGIPRMNRTDDLGKKRFMSMMPARYETVIEFMLAIIDEYSFEVARSKNASLSHLLDKYGICNA